MKQSIEERIEQLKMKNATSKLDLIGRLLVDNREMSMWEHDTETLSWGVRRWRRKALKFSREYIRPLAPEADLHPHDYDPKPILSAAARQGFQTLLFPPPIGTASILPGLRGGSLQAAVVGEEFATECGGLALLLLAHNLGVTPLLLSGSLKTIFRHFIPFYLKSHLLGMPDCVAFAITEPGAGSDVEETEGGAAARLITTAKYVPEKKGYILNGQKCFISDGAKANKVTVYAKIEGEGIESWTCFLVERGMKGFSVGHSERKMGQRASDASELIFDNVFIPNKNVVGNVRSGWANNRNVLNGSRPVVGAMALGHGRGAFERCLEFCRKTNLGPKRLIQYQDVQLELADMAISLSAARTMIWHNATTQLPQQIMIASQAAAAAAKVFASDTAFKVCNQAMELMGDQGYLHVNGVERVWRDSRLTQIYEGTNQICRLAFFEHYLSTDFSL